MPMTWLELAQGAWRASLTTAAQQRAFIHAPLLVGTRCLPERQALPLRPFSSLLRTHDQSLLEVQPVAP